MLETDGTRHRALRKLLQSDFTPRGLAGYEMFLRGITASTLDRALTNPSFDFVADVAADFPIRVLAQLLDVPESDIPQLISGNQMVGNTDPEATAALLYSPESEQFRDLPFGRRRRSRCSSTGTSWRGTAAAAPGPTWSPRC